MVFVKKLTYVLFIIKDLRCKAKRGTAKDSLLHRLFGYCHNHGFWHCFSICCFQKRKRGAAEIGPNADRNNFKLYVHCIINLLMACIRVHTVQFAAPQTALCSVHGPAPGQHSNPGLPENNI